MAEAGISIHIDQVSDGATGVKVIQPTGSAPSLVCLLTDGRISLGADPPPSRRLLAGAATIPFDENLRSEELAMLDAWCSSPEHASMQVLVGPGGSGKTRLAVEYIQRRRALGWAAGFLTQVPGDIAGEAPVLVVVDYAGGKPSVVAWLLRAIAAAEGPRLRVLLLERDVGEWWNAARRDSGAAGHADSRLVWSLRPVAPADRARVFSESVAALGGSALAPPDLSGSIYSRPLAIHLAAFLRLEGDTFENELVELLRLTFDHERRVWQLRSNAEPVVLEAIAASVTALTLLGGGEVEGLDDLIRLASPEPLSMSQVREVRRLLRLLYGSGPQVDGLQPDLLGEYAVAHALDDDPALLSRVFVDADQPNESVFSVLARVEINGFADASRWIGQLLAHHFNVRSFPAMRAAQALAAGFRPDGSLGALIAEALGALGDLDVARSLKSKLPHPSETTSLRELGEVIYRLLRAAEVGERSAAQAVLADRHAAWLGSLGRNKEALAAGQAAVDIYRSLPAMEPAIAADFADALSNLAVRYHRSGFVAEALAAGEEAVRRQEELAAADATLLPRLASCQANLVQWLLAAGRMGEVIEAARRAVDHYRGLAEVQDRHIQRLAGCLSNLGVAYLNQCQFSEALVAFREAVSIGRKLMELHPDSVLPELAGWLGNLGTALNRKNDFDSSLQATREAVAIRRRLARARPDLFLVDLCESLIGLTTDLSDAGLAQEAYETAVEAVESLRDVEFSNRPLARLHLGSALNNLGNAHRARGEYERALSAIDEALTQLDEARTEHRPVRAIILGNRGGVLHSLGRTSEALLASTACVAANRSLCKEHGSAFLFPLCTSIRNLGALQHMCGQLNEALASTQEAMAIATSLAAADPDAFEPLMAETLAAYAAVLDAASRAAIGEALDVMWPRFLKQPQAWAGMVRLLLTNCEILFRGNPGPKLTERLATFERMFGRPGGV